MAGSPEDISDIEKRLRAASAASYARLEARPAETDRLLRRARREISLRDVVTFGFTNLLGAFLHLIAAVAHKQSAQEPKKNNVGALQGEKS